MQSTLKLFFNIMIRCLLACMAINAVVIAPLVAETQDEALAEEIRQSLGLTQGSRWALLVGIADYPTVDGFEIEKLKAPVNDVNALAEFLKAPDKGGFDSDHVFILTDAKATKRDILMTLNNIKNSTASEDMFLFYFSGHGAPPSEDGKAYLIPYDHDLRDVQTTCIDFDELAEKINDMEAKQVIVILDACHSGGIKPKGAKAASAGFLPGEYVDLIQNRFLGAEGRALLISSDESEVSWEDKDRGIFTRFLLEGLEGKADLNNDGIISFNEAALYVETAVPSYTKKKFSRTQRPAHRHLGDVERGEIPIVIDWSKLIAQKQEQLLNERNEAIFMANLSDDVQEFSLQVAQSAHDKALSGETLTKREMVLLEQIDKLRNEDITPGSYMARAPAVYKLGLSQLQIVVTPPDATVTLSSASVPNNIIKSSSPNAYQLEQGDYHLSAKREGYAPYSRDFALNRASETVKVALEQLTGTLQIQVEPADANVTLTPLNIAVSDAEAIAPKGMRVRQTGAKKLPVGTYSVIAEKPGYETAVKKTIEIKVNATIQVTLTLKPLKPVEPTKPAEPAKPKLATILAPDLSGDARVFVNGLAVTLPHTVPPGTYTIRLERDGFESVRMSRTLKSAESVFLRPQWIPIIPVSPADPFSRAKRPGEITRTGAFVASLIVPGLGHHLQKRHKRGVIYEAAVVGTGIMALVFASSYNGKLDDYNEARDQLQLIKQGWSLATETELNALIEKQNEKYDRAKSARTLTIATQIALGIVWVVNAADAGFTMPVQQSEGVVFQALPTSDGAKLMVRASF